MKGSSSSACGYQGEKAEMANSADDCHQAGAKGCHSLQLEEKHYVDYMKIYETILSKYDKRFEHDCDNSADKSADSGLPIEQNTSGSCEDENIYEIPEPRVTVPNQSMVITTNSGTQQSERSDDKASQVKNIRKVRDMLKGAVRDVPKDRVDNIVKTDKAGEICNNVNRQQKGLHCSCHQHELHHQNSNTVAANNVNCDLNVQQKCSCKHKCVNTNENEACSHQEGCNPLTLCNLKNETPNLPKTNNSIMNDITMSHIPNNAKLKGARDLQVFFPWEKENSNLPVYGWCRRLRDYSQQCLEMSSCGVRVSHYGKLRQYKSVDCLYTKEEPIYASPSKSKSPDKSKSPLESDGSKPSEVELGYECDGEESEEGDDSVFYNSIELLDKPQCKVHYPQTCCKAVNLSFGGEDEELSFTPAKKENNCKCVSQCISEVVSDRTQAVHKTPLVLSKPAGECRQETQQKGGQMSRSKCTLSAHSGTPVRGINPNVHYQCSQLSEGQVSLSKEGKHYQPVMVQGDTRVKTPANNTQTPGHEINKANNLEGGSSNICEDSCFHSKTDRKCCGYLNDNSPYGGNKRKGSPKCKAATDKRVKAGEQSLLPQLTVATDREGIIKSGHSTQEMPSHGRKGVRGCSCGAAGVPQLATCRQDPLPRPAEEVESTETVPITQDNNLNMITSKSQQALSRKVNVRTACSLKSAVRDGSHPTGNLLCQAESNKSASIDTTCQDSSKYNVKGKYQCSHSLQKMTILEENEPNPESYSESDNHPFLPSPILPATDLCHDEGCACCSKNGADDSLSSGCHYSDAEIPGYDTIVFSRTRDSARLCSSVGNPADNTSLNPCYSPSPLPGQPPPLPPPRRPHRNFTSFNNTSVSNLAAKGQRYGLGSDNKENIITSNQQTYSNVCSETKQKETKTSWARGLRNSFRRKNKHSVVMPAVNKETGGKASGNALMRAITGSFRRKNKSKTPCSQSMHDWSQMKKVSEAFASPDRPAAAPPRPPRRPYADILRDNSFRPERPPRRRSLPTITALRVEGDSDCLSLLSSFLANSSVEYANRHYERPAPAAGQYEPVIMGRQPRSQPTVPPRRPLSLANMFSVANPESVSPEIKLVKTLVLHKSIGNKWISDLSLTKKGEIVIVDRRRAYLLDSDCCLKRVIGSRDPGRLEEPLGVDILPNGNLVFSDHAGQDLKVFTTKGHFIRRIGSGLRYTSNMTGVATTPYREIITAGGEHDRISVHLEDGRTLTTIPKQGSVSPFDHPFSVAFNPLTSDVIVGDDGKQEVTAWSRDGQLKWRYTRAGPRQFFPSSICVDSQGYVFVADLYNENIYMLDSSGKYIKTILTRGNGLKGNPSAVAVDGKGHLYVADEERVIKVFKYGDNGFAVYSRHSVCPTRSPTSTLL